MAFVTQLIVSALIIYSLLAGGNYDGILNGDRRLLSVVLLGIVSAAWFWKRKRWAWHRTALDIPILLWLAAFTISLLANLESWRRISIGLWYMGLYIALWYLLQDLLANRKIRREWLIDGLLIAGIPVVFVGFAQVQLALVSGEPLPRPVGTLGNPNALGALLVVLLPFIFGRLFMTRRALSRVMLTVYGVAALVLLLLSFSRGGWFGGGVALITWLFLWFPVPRLWAKLPRIYKFAVGAFTLLGVAVAFYILVQSLGMSGRSVDLRTWIYDSGVQIFAERPLTGSGLFTFGAGLSRLNSLPPFEPHSHAHNIVLHVAAELGVVGLLALTATGWVILRAIRRINSPISIMSAAAFTGIIAHHLVDLPAMMPALAIVALITLALCLPPGEATQRKTQLLPVLVGALAVVLFVSGLWSAVNYRQLISALSAGISTENYRAAANQVLSIASTDPALAIYPQQAGMLLGLEAERGDMDAAEEAIEQFQRYTSLEPSYSTGWANLASMYFQSGDSVQAAESMRRAVERAPQSWQLLYRYAVYAEAAANTATAQQAYETALTLNSNLPLLPGWDESPIASTLSTAETEYSTFTRIVFALERGVVDEARSLWEQSGYAALNYSNTHVIHAMLALSEGDQAQANRSLQSARRAVIDRNALTWVYLGEAFLDSSRFDERIATARLALSDNPTEADWPLGANINYIQYLSLALPRQFLPQVGYTETDIILLHLLDSTQALENLRSTLLD